MTYPKVSIILFAKNEEKLLPLCLESIYNQDYPRNKIEVIFVDDMSTDRTAAIAKKYPIRYFSRNSRGNRDANKLFGFRKATGEIVTYLDADIHVRGKKWMKRMVEPLVENKNLAATFTKYYSDSHSSAIERYLNLDPLQRDVIYQFFSPSPEKVVDSIEKNYMHATFSENRIPPQGVCFHRRVLVKKHFKNKRFLELDVLVDLVRNGHTQFGYVPEAGMFHHHAETLRELIRKRGRNVTMVYLEDNESRTYRWFDTRSLRGVLKIFIWVVIVHLIFPLSILGVYKSFKHKTWVGLYEPIVGLLATDAIIYSFLTDKRGRKLI